MTIDWTGLSLFIVACAQAYSIYKGAQRDKIVAAVADKVEAVAIKTEETHKLVNGQFMFKAGQDDQRENPKPTTNIVPTETKPIEQVNPAD